jgi:hypothetical protein
LLTPLPPAFGLLVDTNQPNLPRFFRPAERRLSPSALPNGPASSHTIRQSSDNRSRELAFAALIVPASPLDLNVEFSLNIEV